jgi:catechol 2,3-dioxygenase-like lactoylglutathione lyase family enzyme
MFLEQVALIVHDYDEAIAFFVHALGFELVEDSPALRSRDGRPKRWVVVRPGSYDRMREAGVEFVGEPREEAYGRVAVFLDVAGNRWDLLGPRPAAGSMPS